MTPASYRAVSFNQVPDSPNRIHADDVARQHGFEGGLVPGVTVSAYLAHPGAVAWGEPWLASGRLQAIVHRPLYDGRAFSVEVAPTADQAYEATLLEGGASLASATARLDGARAEPPVRRGDPPIDGVLLPPTREGLEALRDRGMRSLRVVWEPAAQMATYFRDAEQMPQILRPSGAGLANDAFLLAMTNWLLAANVDLGPWLHLQVDAQHYTPVPLGSAVTIEGAVADLFEKKGHHFVDVDNALFLDDGRPVMTVRLRAIYRLRS
jgi:hypothetical protein